MAQDDEEEMTEPVDNTEEGAEEGDYEEGAGPQMVEDIGFDQDVQNILWSRIQNLLTPEDMQILDQVITPQTYPVLVKLFPELQLLLAQASSAQGMQQGPIQGAPQPPAGPMQGPAQPQQRNPLSAGGASRGLTGY